MLLVIRNSGGEVRWMEVRDWLKRASYNGRKPVKQIVFAGERFDAVSVQNWRKKVLSERKWEFCFQFQRAARLPGAAFFSGERPPLRLATVVARGALRADEIAQTAEFFSFGTNDLTQTSKSCWRVADNLRRAARAPHRRDNSGSFLAPYQEAEIFKKKSLRTATICLD